MPLFKLRFNRLKTPSAFIQLSYRSAAGTALRTGAMSPSGNWHAGQRRDGSKTMRRSVKQSEWRSKCRQEFSAEIRHHTQAGSRSAQLKKR